MIAAAHAQGAKAQTIQFLPLTDRPVTSAPFQIVAVASSDLPVTLAVQGPATLDARRLLTLTAPGVVTVTASQPGNTQYAPAPAATLKFNVTPAAARIAWQPKSIVYGSPLSASGLNATATASPVVSATADIAAITSQLGSSQIIPNGPIPYPQTSSVFRYEGATMVPSTGVNDKKGYVPSGTLPPKSLNYRVAFTCDCAEFEFVVQSRSSTYWLWVDGSFQGLDATSPADHFPEVNYVLVKFPDKRVRQIKGEFSGGPPFFGVVTGAGDTVSAPQVPLGSRVNVFGDSWTGPTIVQAYLPPAQAGLSGAGYGAFLGQFFNWDYWISGVGGEGFTTAGTDPHGSAFPQRVLTDVCPNSPSAVLIMGGVNDGGANEATAQTGIASTLSNLKTCLPGVPVYLYGPQFAAPTIETAFADVVTGYTNVHYTDMGAQAWLYGSITSASAGNEYLYFDGHPTPLGHNYLAEKMAVDLIAAYPSLQPTAYPLMTPAPAAGSISYSSNSSAVLPAGNNTVTAEFTPTDTTDYADASLVATVVVTKATTTTTLTQKTANGVPTVSVTVTPQIAGTPSGSIVVSEGSTKLVTLSLSSGGASYTASALANGAHTLTLSYSGDSNFTASNATISVTVNQVAADFSLTATPAQLTLAPGADGNVSLKITPVGPLSATLSLACTGLPVNTNCAFADGTSTIAVGAEVLTPTVVIHTTKSQTSLAAPEKLPGMPFGAGGASVCGVLGVGLLGLARKRRVLMLTGLAVLALGAVGLSGCGTPLGTYPVQITLTNTATASMTHSASITLTVN